jgi:methyltransferase (TIGR00027 family)
MQADRPSATAQKVAIRRAAHQLLDKPLVFEDPLAIPIIGPRAAGTLTANPARFQTRSSRFLRAFMAARSRFSQDELALAVSRGVEQCVILGAGLDTFAFRNPYPQLRVFEVDHPATQAWKRMRLEMAGIEIPASVTFAPADFEHETFADALAHAGFLAAQPAFFSWLGVTPYLTRENTLSTLRLIRSLSPGNSVVFDFAVPRHSLGEIHQAAFDLLASRVASVGEPFQGFFFPTELVASLEEMGFSHVEDLAPDAINARYFHDREDGLHVAGALAHLMCARG